MPTTWRQLDIAESQCAGDHNGNQRKMILFGIRCMSKSTWGNHYPDCKCPRMASTGYSLGASVTMSGPRSARGGQPFFSTGYGWGLPSVRRRYRVVADKCGRAGTPTAAPRAAASTLSSDGISGPFSLVLIIFVMPTAVAAVT